MPSAMADRRPLRFWQPFNDWWRAEFDKLQRRPNAQEIQTWYQANAYGLWQDEAPTLQETRIHAKCLRSLPLVREYFRTYRAKKRKASKNKHSSDDEDHYGGEEEGDEDDLTDDPAPGPPARAQSARTSNAAPAARHRGVDQRAVQQQQQQHPQPLSHPQHPQPWELYPHPALAQPTAFAADAPMPFPYPTSYGQLPGLPGSMPQQMCQPAGSHDYSNGWTQSQISLEEQQELLSEYDYAQQQQEVIEHQRQLIIEMTQQLSSQVQPAEQLPPVAAANTGGLNLRVPHAQHAQHGHYPVPAPHMGGAQMPMHATSVSHGGMAPAMGQYGVMQFAAPAHYAVPMPHWPAQAYMPQFAAAPPPPLPANHCSLLDVRRKRHQAQPITIKAEPPRQLPPLGPSHTHTLPPITLNDVVTGRAFPSNPGSSSQTLPGSLTNSMGGYGGPGGLSLEPLEAGAQRWMGPSDGGSLEMLLAGSSPRRGSADQSVQWEALALGPRSSAGTGGSRGQLPNPTAAR